MHRFKKIIVEGIEFDPRDLDTYNELRWLAYEMGRELDPETFKIVPIREQTKRWENGDREPLDYQGWE